MILGVENNNEGSILMDMELCEFGEREEIESFDEEND